MAPPAPARARLRPISRADSDSSTSKPEPCIAPWPSRPSKTISTSTKKQPLLDLAEDTRIRLEPQLEGNRVLLDDLDVSRRIRDTDVTAAASRVSVHPRLRAWMVSQQRALGAKGGVVMEGRDIGTAVFPDAEVKIFLDASPEVRGDRRYRQVALPPDPDDDDVPTPPAAPPTAEQLAAQLKILTEMKERDARDRNRAQSPLRPAADAVILDSTTTYPR